MAELKDKVALITGAGRGIGRATAVLLAAEGAEIMVQDIDADLAAQTVEAVRASGAKAQPIVADVADVAELTARIREAETEAGHIDILVNNAGIARPKPIEEIDEEAFDRMFGVHVKGTFFATQAVIPGMKARRYGKIVTVSSIAGLTGLPGDSHYSGAKAALLGLTKSWAKELAPYGIHVNAVAPGGTITEMVLAKGGMERVERRASKMVPLGRYAEPPEIAHAILFLASPRSDFITGQVISPNGGETIV